MSVRYVAHRGYSMAAPENTIPAFELAGQAGFWAIECDTYCTTDGRWIVHHDPTVDRMTDGTGRTNQFTFSEIKSLSIDAGHHIEQYPGLTIPTLEEVLAVCKKYDMHAFIEIELFHRPSDLEALLELIDSAGMKDKSALICFNADHLRAVRDLCQHRWLGYLSSKPPTSSDLAFAKELGNTFLNYEYKGVTPEMIQQCHNEGIEVSVWTVNMLEEARLMIEAGADYITTDTVLHK